MKYIVIIAALLACQLCFAQNQVDAEAIGSNTDQGAVVTIDGVKLYYEVYGEGEPLLLLHGGMSSIGEFKGCIPKLAEHFKVIALDSPCHGKSAHVEALSYDLMSEYVSKFIKHLKLDSVNIIGTSDGGVTGLILAANHPEQVRKLIAVGANSRLDGIQDETVDWIRNHLIEWMMNDKAWVDGYLSLTPEPDQLNDFLKKIQKMWLTEVYLSDEAVKSISVPVMIMQGDKDIIKKEHSIELYENIPHSQLSILPNTTHFVAAEQPELLSIMGIGFFVDE